MSEAGVHRPHVTGIAGTGDLGCQSLDVSKQLPIKDLKDMIKEK